MANNFSNIPEFTPEEINVWESREFGQSEEFAEVSTYVPAKSAEDILGLKSISLRLQPYLIDNLKLIGENRGIKYQTLIKQILTRFVDSELKLIEKEKIIEQRQQIEELVNRVKSLEETIKEQKIA